MAKVAAYADQQTAQQPREHFGCFSEAQGASGEAAARERRMPSEQAGAP
jgi:hypothetical protein